MHPPSRRLLTALVSLITIMLVVAGCGSTDSARDTSSSSTTPKVTRIVSLSPTATETLYAIDAGDQVVAVDDQSNYPVDAPRTSLSGFTPNVEAIAAKKPQLVVISYDPGGLVDGLEKLKIRVAMQPPVTSLDDAYAQIEELGKVTGHQREATKLTDHMRSELRQIADDMPADTAKSTVYHELDPTGYSLTSSSFTGEIYQMLGLSNIADSAKVAKGASPQLSAEFVAKANPDLIVLADTKCCKQDAASVAARPGWSQITAVRDGRIIEVDDDIASRWGPRLVDFARQVATQAGSADEAAAAPARAAA